MDFCTGGGALCKASLGFQKLLLLLLLSLEGKLQTCLPGQALVSAVWEIKKTHEKKRFHSKDELRRCDSGFRIEGLF